MLKKRKVLIRVRGNNLCKKMKMKIQRGKGNLDVTLVRNIMQAGKVYEDIYLVFIKD
jgi:hypothetical protein